MQGNKTIVSGLTHVLWFTQIVYEEVAHLKITVFMMTAILH